MTIITYIWDILIELLYKLEDELDEFIQTYCYLFSDDEDYEYDQMKQYIHETLMIIG